eukprot:tig00000963_g5816.t1
MKRPTKGERDASDLRDAHAMSLTAGMVLNLIQVMDSFVGDQNGGKGVVMLDQPTDGLDAAGSLDLCRALRSFAESGVAVVCSLLQPSWDVYSLFDQLILLAPGQCAYQARPFSNPDPLRFLLFELEFLRYSTPRRAQAASPP